MTYGTGRLDRNGFWEFPCAICELAHHHRERDEVATASVPSSITRIYLDARVGEPLRLCLFCGLPIRNGQEVIDLVGPALGSIAHASCNSEVLASGAYV